MKKKIQCSLALFAIFLSACQSDVEDKKTPKAEPIQPRIAAKIKTDNDFAFDLFKATYAQVENEKKEGNVFVSPLSVSLALNMVVNGAKGDTEKEIIHTLRAENYTVSDINEYSKSLTEALLKVDPSTQLNIANSIWYKQEFPVKQAFVETNQGYYQAEVKALDFNSPGAVNAINGWCDKETRGKIPAILEKIERDAVMYLINAVYFKGIWVSRFDKRDTRKDNFNQANGKTVQVDMMNQKGTFNCYDNESFQFLEMPYGNDAFSMVIMLPVGEKTIADVIQNLDNEQWDQAVSSFTGREVNINLPRFKAECFYEMHDDILPSLGMKVPFSSLADFSGISVEPTQISQVIHKTFVEVNEEGTEAAAVTSVGMVGTSIDPNLIEFYVNKPFLLAIREKSTGAILFIGKIGEIK